MSYSRVAILILTVGVCLLPKAGAVDIDALVKAIELEKGWKVESVSHGKKKDGKLTELPWALLKGPKAGETVTIIVNERESGKVVQNIESCSDSAHEYCPEGRPIWRPSKNALTVHPLFCRTTTLLGELYQVLEYSFITERDVDENLMAHGLVLFGDASVYVQHTSPLAITRDVSESYAHDLMRHLAEVSDARNLLREEDEKSATKVTPGGAGR